MRVEVLATVLVVMGGLLVAGCDSDEETNVDFATTRDGGVAAGPIVIGDPQAAEVVITLNSGEVLVAQSVAPRLTRNEVVDFASRMINEHSQANRDAEAVASKQGITPANSNLSAALQQSASTVVQQLMSQNPVDTPYINSQVSMHVQALALIDCVLVPSAQDTTWRDFITGSLRPAVALHLEQAGVIAGTAPISTGTFDCTQLCTSTALDASVRAVACR